MDFKIVFIVSCLLSASCTDPIGSKSDRLKIEADTLNAHCPQKLDSETELQKVNWTAPYFKYAFRLVNIAEPFKDTNAFKSLLLPGLYAEIHMRNDSVECKKQSVIFVYTYYDSHMNYLCSVTLPYNKTLP
ncbi:MAG: hypothetical protein ACO27Q_08025 [Bacteroidia bacterium]|jgi:hypothetical protein